MNLYLLDDNKNVDQVVELQTPKIKIGRESDNDICLDIPGVSRYHCEMILENGKWYINDIESTNGTKVNNLPIKAMYLLHEGDLIDIGDQHLRFSDASASTHTELRSVFPINSSLADTAAMPVQNNFDPERTSQRIELFDATETLKGEIPRMDGSNACSTPSIIINLPQTSEFQTPSASGSIIFEPLNDVQKNTSQTAGIKLTPAPAETTSLGANSMPSSHPEEHSKQIAATKLPENVSLFGRKDNNKSLTEQVKRRSTNMLFYTCAICIPIIFICLFIIVSRGSKVPQQPVKIVTDSPEKLIVNYEKKVVGKDNVFRFQMLLDQGHVIFMLDDLRSRRHYLKEDKAVKSDLLLELYNDIKDSDFMDLSPVSEGALINNTDESRTMMIRYNDKAKTMIIRNNYAPNSFEAIERAINDFAGQYGLQTISMTPEELKREADIAFNKAEELFNNRDAAPENLRKALIRYQVTVDYLDQFAPKPQQWTLSKKRIAETEELISRRFKDLAFDYNRLIKLKNDREALEVLDRLLPLLDPASKNYQKFQAARIKLENKLRKDSKK